MDCSSDGHGSAPICTLSLAGYRGEVYNKPIQPCGLRLLYCCAELSSLCLVKRVLERPVHI